MSLDSLLIHTCVIENPAVGSTNAYNNAVTKYVLPLENVRCRLVESNEPMQTELRIDEVSEGVIKSVYKLMVRGDVDLQEKAKISSVTLEDGTVISDVFEVVSVLNRHGRSLHHKTATLERIS